MRTSRSTLRQTQAILCGQLSRHVHCGLAKTHTTCRNFGPIHATSMLHYCAVGCNMHVKKTVKEAQDCCSSTGNLPLVYPICSFSISV